MLETREQMQPQTEAGTAMARLVREAWLATAEIDGVVDGETRQSAFLLVLEAMLRNGESAEPASQTESADPFDASFQPIEQDDLYPTPELRTDAISAYLRIESGQGFAVVFR